MMCDKTKLLILRSPLPFVAASGLILGILAHFVHGLAGFSHWIWILTILLAGSPIVIQTILGMLKGKFASDVVAMLAILVSLALGQSFAGAVVVLMQSGGEAIEAFGKTRASSALTELLKKSPRKARKRTGEVLEEVDVEDVQVGDLLVVRQGDLIPVDGILREGVSDVDEATLTGESLPQTKTKGSELLGGSVALNGSFTMQAEKKYENSQYAKIVLLVKKAQEEKAPIQRLADRYAIFFTPLALVISLLGYLITKDSTTILSVLVVATPCPLILATPLAVLCGMNRAANLGIIVKGGVPIEQIASAKAVLFDKTGTLTQGIPQVKQVTSLGNQNERTLLLLAGILEQYSSHSVAKALVEAAKQYTPNLPLPQACQEFPGQGLIGKWQDKTYLLGSSTFILQRLGKEAFHSHQIHPHQEGQLAIYLAEEGVLLGLFLLSDQLRPHVQELLQRLRHLGIQKIALLTGDSFLNAQMIAKEAGIETFFAELLPEDKVDTVREMEKLYHPVIMVGDGINDAPALASATIGIAMGAHGAAVSSESADIVLLEDDLLKVAETIAIGKKMLRIAQESIFAGMGLSLVLMIIAASGHILPAVGALLQEIIDVIVILNALRARH